MPILTIRSFTAGDLTALRELFLNSRRAAFAWQDGEHFQLLDFDVQTAGEQILLAEIEGACAGFISVWTPDLFIHHLYVDAPYTRRGVGRALLQALPGWAQTHYQLKCLARNTPALAFYTRCGFEDIGGGTSSDGDYRQLQHGGNPRRDG